MTCSTVNCRAHRGGPTDRRRAFWPAPSVSALVRGIANPAVYCAEFALRKTGGRFSAPGLVVCDAPVAARPIHALPGDQTDSFPVLPVNLAQGTHLLAGPLSSTENRVFDDQKSPHPCKHRANTRARHADTGWTRIESRVNGFNHLEPYDTRRYGAIRVRIPLALPAKPLPKPAWMPISGSWTAPANPVRRRGPGSQRSSSKRQSGTKRGRSEAKRKTLEGLADHL
jgi:hypothetical protein